LGQLLPLQIFSIASAGFETFAKVEMAAGRKLGDIKPRALSPQTNWPQYFTSASVSPDDTQPLTNGKSLFIDS